MLINGPPRLLFFKDIKRYGDGSIIYQKESNNIRRKIYKHEILKSRLSDFCENILIIITNNDLSELLKKIVGRTFFSFLFLLLLLFCFLSLYIVYLISIN